MVKTPRIRYLLPWMKLVALLRRLDEFCYLTSTLDIQRSRVVFCIAVELRRRHVVLIKHVSTSTGTGYRRYRITYHTIFCSKVKLFTYIHTFSIYRVFYIAVCVYRFPVSSRTVPQIVVNSQLSALSSQRHLSNNQLR